MEGMGEGLGARVLGKGLTLYSRASTVAGLTSGLDAFCRFLEKTNIPVAILEILVMTVMLVIRLMTILIRLAIIVLTAVIRKQEQ